MRYFTKAVVLPVGVLIAILSTMVLFFSSSGPTAAPARTSQITRVELSSSYEYKTLDDLVQDADAIFIGKVVSITPTRWNQDSGAFWEDAVERPLPYYEIEVEVQKSLVDTLNLDKQVMVTVIGGSSPTGTDPVSTVQVGGEGEVKLRKGKHALFLIRETQMAWYSPKVPAGQRRVLVFMGVPDYSYLLQQADGTYRTEDSNEKERVLTLEQVTEKIKKLR